MADKYRADDHRIMASGTTEVIEEQYIKDGRTFWAETTKASIQDEMENITGIMGVFNDITERRQAEDELRAQQRPAIAA